jgi:hypothetical protein
MPIGTDSRKHREIRGLTNTLWVAIVPKQPTGGCVEQFVLIIFTILMTLTPSLRKVDIETTQEREARMLTTAQAIGYASYRATCQGDFATDDCVPITKDKYSHAVALITLGYWESRLSKHVHEGNCISGWTPGTNKYEQGECDEIPVRDQSGNIVRTVFLARTMWQMHKDLRIVDEWNNMGGTSLEATKNAAWAASKKWAGCGNMSTKSAFMCYAGTLNPKWSGLMPRVDFYNWNLAHARKLQNNQIEQKLAEQERNSNKNKALD